MTITDAERHRLHTSLTGVLGERAADVLMRHLPPTGWSDLARRDDVDRLRAHLDERFATLDERFAAIDQRFATLDQRFATMEARFDAGLQTALREQTNRILVALIAIMSCVGILMEWAAR